MSTKNNDLFGDCVASELMAQFEINKNVIHATPMRVYDTQEIMDVYMERPKELSYMSLGLWFAKAHNLEDKQLRDFGIFTIQCKRYMIANKLTQLPIERLKEYNNAWRDKIERKKQGETK